MTEPRGIAYTRRVIQIESADAGFDQALSQLAAFGDAIAVNVVDPARSAPIVLSEVHLRQAVAAAPGRLEVDTIPMTTFLEVMRLKLSELDRQGSALRGTLRSDYVEDAMAAIQPLLRQLDQIMFLVSAYAIQRPDERIGPAAAGLTSGRAAIVRAVETRDNVCGMDALHYEMTPAVRQLALVFTP